MELCGGALLVHLDATQAACTEELDGRCCAGVDAVHLGGSLSCAEVLGPGGCETCELQSWGEPEWRHAARIGVIARRAGRCHHHRRVHQVPSAANGLAALLAQLDSEWRAQHQHQPS